jgi:hypothetical protein
MTCGDSSLNLMKLASGGVILHTTLLAFTMLTVNKAPMQAVRGAAANSEAAKH